MENINNSTEHLESTPIFSPEEARVVACLMEKQLTTPNYYPLTLKALTSACNQKSSREPMMSLSEGEVGHTANLLAEREFLKVNYGDRANRFAHRMKEHFDLDRPELAILNVLMLRNPQTLNDIQRRTARMVDFEDHESVRQVLDALMARDQPMVVLLPSTPGQREDRYGHLLCGDVSTENDKQPLPIKPTTGDNRFEKLEERVAILETKLAEVVNKISGTD